MFSVSYAVAVAQPMYFRKSSQWIGANELWIAASALATGFPMVTDNTKHFSRVPGLKLMGY